MAPRVLFCYIVFLLQCCQAMTSSSCDPISQYPKFGKCCDKCPPGTYMSSECAERNTSGCQPCGPDRYQSEWNMLEHCHLHKTCSNKAENFIIPICEKCEAGYYSNVSSNLEACRKWSNCGLLKMIADGTTTKDVECGTPEPLSKVGLVVGIVFLSGVLLLILLTFFIHSGYNQENRTKVRNMFTRLMRCTGKIQMPIQELTENGRILATAGDEDKSPEVMTELMPV
ncbi:tumor necrosis factor receptor superfamily member 5-like isoform X3 [Narcine bancroftii]|uniref:tumor necrosis factor receptor superfamily member 5-like isoform X3 n=1 Tax=Narcine bancroftii TaxID=1343680 RepID=UPI003831D898